MHDILHVKNELKKAIENTTTSAIDTFECECIDGFSGPTCEITPCSDPDLCKNGGICTLVKLHEYECTCMPGYYGQHCDKRPCDNVDCHSRGTCVNLLTSSTCKATAISSWHCEPGTDYKCDCDEGLSIGSTICTSIFFIKVSTD